MKNSFVLILSLFSLPAQAWDHHQGLMVQMMDTDAAKSRAYLSTMITIPSEKEQKITLENLAKELDVNLEKIPLQKPGKVSIRDFVQDDSIDEPDFGMDQDLPDSADPKNDRPWMGGKTGPTSQGFRHMFFPGLEWSSPIRTLQIPVRSIGQSPERILKLHAISLKFLAEKNSFWAIRTLMWELHLIQDLHQPFHVMQVPYIKMLPWKELFHSFVSRSTQVIANFHYAYEDLINESVGEGKISVLAPCFELPSGDASIPAVNEQVIMDIVHLSRESAYKIGVPLYQLWNAEMKDPVVNLPDGMGTIDYYSYLHANPDEDDQKKKVELVHDLLKTTCELMKHVSQVTFSELDRLLQ
jgi:hypothetical protein